MSDENLKLEFHTEAADTGRRLDVFLSEKIADWSRTRIKKLITGGGVLVNGNPVKSSHKLRSNDLVSVEPEEPRGNDFEPEDIPLDIVYEDEYLAVIDKPAGMVVHPGAGTSGGTLANAIAWHFDLRPSAESEHPADRVGIVHRLDKHTSGLIVIARNGITHDRLSRQFAARKVFKSYVALVHGFVRKRSGKIDEPIGRDRIHRVKMSVQSKGRNALTVYKVRQRFERYTLLDVEIKTGRTHQIRVHLAHLKHPIVGDATYNDGRDKTIPNPLIRKAVRNLGRFFLHSARLSFTHPVSKKWMEFEAPLSVELDGLLKMIKNAGP